MLACAWPVLAEAMRVAVVGPLRWFIVRRRSAMRRQRVVRRLRFDARRRRGLHPRVIIITITTITE